MKQLHLNFEASNYRDNGFKDIIMSSWAIYSKYVQLC